MTCIALCANWLWKLGFLVLVFAISLWTSSGCKKWHHVGYHTNLQAPICGKDMLLLTSTFNGTTMKIMHFRNVPHTHDKTWAQVYKPELKWQINAEKLLVFHYRCSTNGMTCCHVAQTVKYLLEKEQWKTPEHYPYSLDISPSDLELFQKMKKLYNVSSSIVWQNLYTAEQYVTDIVTNFLLMVAGKPQRVATRFLAWQETTLKV